MAGANDVTVKIGGRYPELHGWPLPDQPAALLRRYSHDQDMEDL